MLSQHITRTHKIQLTTYGICLFCKTVQGQVSPCLTFTVIKICIRRPLVSSGPCGQKHLKSRHDRSIHIYTQGAKKCVHILRDVLCMMCIHILAPL